MHSSHFVANWKLLFATCGTSVNRKHVTALKSFAKQETLLICIVESITQKLLKARKTMFFFLTSNFKLSFETRQLFKSISFCCPRNCHSHKTSVQHYSFFSQVRAPRNCWAIDYWGVQKTKLLWAQTHNLYPFVHSGSINQFLFLLTSLEIISQHAHDMNFTSLSFLPPPRLPTFFFCCLLWKHVKHQSIIFSYIFIQMLNNLQAPFTIRYG